MGEVLGGRGRFGGRGTRLSRGGSLPPRSSSPHPKKIFKKGLTNGKKFDIIVRSTVKKSIFAGMAQLVEHVIGNDEVISSTLIASSRNRIAIAVRFLFFCFQTEERRGFEPWKTEESKRARAINRAGSFWWSVGDSEPKCAASEDVIFS